RARDRRGPSGAVRAAPHARGSYDGRRRTESAGAADHRRHAGADARCSGARPLPGRGEGRPCARSPGGAAAAQQRGAAASPAPVPLGRLAGGPRTTLRAASSLTEQAARRGDVRLLYEPGTALGSLLVAAPPAASPPSRLYSRRGFG